MKLTVHDLPGNHKTRAIYLIAQEFWYIDLRRRLLSVTFAPLRLCGKMHFNTRKTSLAERISKIHLTFRVSLPGQILHTKPYSHFHFLHHGLCETEG